LARRGMRSVTAQLTMRPSRRAPQDEEELVMASKKNLILRGWPEMN